MGLTKTDKARAELLPGNRTLGQRERGLLLLADGRKTAHEVGAYLGHEGERLVLQLLRDGYLAHPLAADPFDGRRSMASTRMFCSRSADACLPGVHRTWPNPFAKPCAMPATAAPCGRSATRCWPRSKARPGQSGPTRCVNASPCCYPRHWRLKPASGRRPTPVGQQLTPHPHGGRENPHRTAREARGLVRRSSHAAIALQIVLQCDELLPTHHPRCSAKKFCIKSA